MDDQKQEGGLAGVSRRDFLLTTAAAGVGLGLARAARAQDQAIKDYAGGDVKPLNVAIIGTGAQGRVLIESCLRIPGIHFKAVCDIWEYSHTYASRFLKKYGQEVNVYEDYREMLDKEKDLNAVIVATPDWMHAEHANACMEAGLDVYCEKEMSNSLDKAASMVLTQRRTGRVLQIGHQRRSNPRYRHAIERLILKEKLLGQVTQAYGQWNRAKSDDLGWPAQYEITPEKLEQFGYASMHEFRNWRWFKKYGGGPIVDLGSHQIDLYSWVFGGPPKSVTADGGVDFYTTHEWYDNVMAIYEFDTALGRSRAFYQVLTTTSYGGFSEAFLGVDGSLQISEVPTRGNWANREAHADETKWDELAKAGALEKVVVPLQPSSTKNVQVDVRVTADTGRWPLPVELAKPAHQPHLENFFDAIRQGTPLNCPAEVGYETAVMVLRVNEAVAAGCKLEFKPEDFVV